MSITSEEIAVLPPRDLPTTPADFWGSPPGELFKPTDSAASTETPVIDQLGSAPFKKPDKGGFPFLGFLASVYEHVSTTATNELHSPPTPGEAVGATQGDETTTEPAAEAGNQPAADDSRSFHV